jgi:dihydrofolate reductase
VEEFSGGATRSGSSAGFSIVVALDRKRGIGKDGGLPWPKLKGDMKFFRELTTCPDRAAVEKRWGLKPEESAETKSWNDVSAMLKFAHPLPAASDEKRNSVIMGRKTWESLPVDFRPLSLRHNMVMSRNEEFIRRELPRHPKVTFLSGNISPTLSAPLDKAIPGFPPLPYLHLFVIGGGQVFVDVLQYSSCGRIYVTEIDAEFSCDTFFPETHGFAPVLSSPWIEENGIKYRFRRYDRV